MHSVIGCLQIVTISTHTHTHNDANNTSWGSWEQLKLLPVIHCKQQPGQSISCLLSRTVSTKLLITPLPHMKDLVSNRDAGLRCKSECQLGCHHYIEKFSTCTTRSKQAEDHKQKNTVRRKQTLQQETNCATGKELLRSIMTTSERPDCPEL